MNFPPETNTIKSVFTRLSSCILILSLAANKCEAGYFFVSGNKNLDLGLIVIVEFLDEVIFSGEVNGERARLSTPTWHC